MQKNISATLCVTILCLISAGSCWLNCSDVEFCVRIRYNEVQSNYSLDLNRTEINGYSVSSILINTDTGKEYNFTLNAVQGGVFRVLIDDPLNPRHRVLDVLDGDPNLLSITNVDLTETSMTVYSESTQAVIWSSPFRIQFYKDGTLIAVINNANRLVFEDESDTAIALDVYYPNALRAYGLPEHADNLPLRSTRSKDIDPYRFYNIDNAEYEEYSTQALYGAVPVLYTHSLDGSSGFFWLNTAQTFVDIEHVESGIETFFFSESGVIDFFVLTGPTLRDAVIQYAGLTGKFNGRYIY